MGGDEDPAGAPPSGCRKTFWRSASWSSSRSLGPDHSRESQSEDKSSSSNGQPWRCPAPPLTPRSLSVKARSCLPPLQPLSIARPTLDEWPRAGSDDIGEWPQPPTPSSKPDAQKPGEGLKLDLSSLRSQVRKDQIAFFDKECSKVADHIYLGGDSVARNLEILRRNGITHVLNCVGFVCPEYFKSDFVYKTLWLQDSPSEDISSILYDVFDYFEDVRQQGGRVLVHCCQGVSRSTSLVIAYLMWREGQSFDDAFQFVKAARGIANPNVGFACQLLQCQKRVHAIPLSPNSMLRMYRMAPHSAYDPLHLVPKMLNEPSPTALDSRGAFIVHVVSSIYVWIGGNCHAVMEKDAKAAAFQVVRYEKVQGQIMIVVEGEEPLEFWEVFSSAPPNLEGDAKINKEHVQSAATTISGKRKVGSYDSDFEIFYKAITGGVVPPFSSSGPGQETHLPARESNWSLLRRKFMSGSTFRVHTDSTLVRDRDPRADRVQLLAAESSMSPPFLSPSSISSESSISSKYSSDSLSISPSTGSPPSLAPSPPSSYLPNPLVPSSRSPLRRTSCADPLKPGQEAVLCPSIGLAERRGSFSPMKLPTLVKDSSILIEIISSTDSERTELVDRGSDKSISSGEDLHVINGAKPLSVANCSTDSTTCMSVSDDPYICHQGQNDQQTPVLTEFVNTGFESHYGEQLLVYRWPGMQKLATFSREDLDSKSVYAFLTSRVCKSQEADRMLCLWIGNGFDHCNRKAECEGGNDAEAVNFNWHQVAGDVLDLAGIRKDIPIKVFKEDQTESLLELLNTA